MKEDNQEDPLKTEINEYLKNVGMRIYTNEFSRAAQERHDSLVYRLHQCCSYFKIESVEDPRFRVVSDTIESTYPTYGEILDSIIKDEDLRLPTSIQIKEKMMKLKKCAHFNSL